MVWMHDQRALSLRPVEVLLRPPPALRRGALCAGELMPPLPHLHQPTHVPIENREQVVLRAAVTAIGGSGIVDPHGMTPAKGGG